MSQSLFEPVDPNRLCDLGAAFSGSVEMTKMRRLAPLMVDVEGEARYEFSFGIDEQGFRCLVGQVSGTLNLLCQRCLEPFSLSAECAVSLALVQGLEEASLLPERFDPLLLDEEKLRLIDIVEDELLLAIPTVPRHPFGACKVAMAVKAKDQPLVDTEETPSKKNPFAVLAELKKQN